MPVENVAGFPTYLQSMGQGAKPALLIHCSLAHSGLWGPVMGHLDDVLVAKAFDLPDHGRSGGIPEGSDFHDLSCQVAKGLLDAPAHIIGHSFGATVALRLAVEHPELVKSLTLIEPVYFAATKGSVAFERYERELQPFVDAWAEGDKAAAAKEFNTVWGASSDWDRVSANQQQEMIKRIHVIEASTSAIFADKAGVFRAGRLEALDMPVLILEGSESPDIIAAINDVLERRIPGSTRVVIKGGAHMCPITHAGPVAGAISDFLIGQD